MLDVRSDYLVILVATYNRLDLLKLTLNSISAGVDCSHEIIVIDGGSTDGTVEYLKSHPNVTPVFQGQLLGTARCYNQVWRQIESKYTCWLSDDTEIVAGSLDLAVDILENHPEIGMVGLKMKDTVGPYQARSYMGALSEFKILNCNHGVLPTSVLKSVGYFNERYRSYTIDPDLTASVLCTGRSVVMTKQISVLHHRKWAEHAGEEKVNSAMGGIDNYKIYHEKFKFLESPHTNLIQLKSKIFYLLGRILFLHSKPDSMRLGMNRRDWYNLTEGRFIRLTDMFENRQRPYHLIQKVSRHLLLLETNPYRYLVED